MLLLIILTILLAGNWIISELLVFFPLDLLNQLVSWGWLTGLFMFFLFLAWCLGDE